MFMYDIKQQLLDLDVEGSVLLRDEASGMSEALLSNTL